MKLNSKKKGARWQKRCHETQHRQKLEAHLTVEHNWQLMINYNYFCRPKDELGNFKRGFNIFLLQSKNKHFEQKLHNDD